MRQLFFRPFAFGDVAIHNYQSVDLAMNIDPAIIGGLIVKLGSRRVDSSLRTKLNSMKHAMKKEVS